MSEGATTRYDEDRSLRLLEDCLIRLQSLAPVPRAEQIRDLMAIVPADSRKLILVELIKCDMAAAAEIGIDRRLDFYLHEFSDWLPPTQIPPDLILEEIQLRREAGEEPNWADYCDRFPGLASTMGKLLAAGEATARCGQRTPLPELPLHQTVDDFHILALLGQGAFARVYLARQESMQRLVALKATVRGSDEPQALSQLDHPNIVRVYDQRICKEPALRLLYMQYVPGGTLAECIELLQQRPVSEWSGKLIIEAIDRCLIRGGQTRPEQSQTREALINQDWPTTVTWIGVQLAEGLHYAHGQGVLHRDVKPANILLSSDGVPKLADFNVSLSGVAGRAGAAANFGGSLAYMSPEHLRAADPTDSLNAADLDNRADLFSLGVVLWELNRGERPWKTDAPFDDWSSAIQAQLAARQSPLPEASSTHGVGRVLDRVLRWVLSFSADERPRSGAELAGALRLALYPDVAERFHPSPNSFPDRIRRFPSVLVLVLLALLPNVAAAVFNFEYNHAWMEERYPHLWRQFMTLSLIVNSVLFPLGIVLALRRLLPITRLIRLAQAGKQLDDAPLEPLWNFGSYVALLSGTLWLAGGIIFPLVLTRIEPNYHFIDAAHFFLSLAICGGVAMTYPFFSISWIAALHYYPLLIRNRVVDPAFDRRRTTLIRRCWRYLALAVAVPLLALVLLVMRDNPPKIVLLTTIATTAVGLVASFLAYQKIDDTLRQMGEVVSPQHSLAKFMSEH